MKFKYTIVVALVALFVGDVAGGPLRNRFRRTESVSPSTSSSVGAPAGAAGEASDALDHVNAERAKRGLAPYIRDHLLTQGAMACAKFRAERLIPFHTDNDFRFLPGGASARVGGAGTGGYGPWGFLACAMFERDARYAGAAWARGRDGKMYCQTFVK